MSMKRFVQLFVLYFLSILIAMPLTNLLQIQNRFFTYLVVSIIGYLVLTIPLTIMTIQKEKKTKK
ncbi:hypothetical protein ACYSNO_00790 [Enterococcus sp. LJL98]